MSQSSKKKKKKDLLNENVFMCPGLFGLRPSVLEELAGVDSVSLQVIFEKCWKPGDTPKKQCLNFQQEKRIGI